MIGRLRRLVYLLPVAGCAANLLGAWPGALNPDIATTINEGLGFLFLGHQAPLFGFVWSIALAVLPVPVAIEACFVLLVVSYWMAFALLAHVQLREGSSLGAVMVGLTAFLPPLCTTVSTIDANVIAGTFWFAAIALATAFPGTRSLVAGLLLIFVGFIIRSGTLVSVGPVLYACFVLNRPKMRARMLAFSSLVSLTCFLLISSAVTQLWLGAPSRGRVVSVSQLFDIAGVYQLTHTHCVPPSLVPTSTTAEAVMAHYDGGVANSIFWDNPAGGFKAAENEEEFAALRACWVQTLRQHPRAYLQVKLHFARLFLSLGEYADSSVAGMPDTYSNLEFGLAPPHSAIWNALEAYVEFTAGMAVWKGWFWILVAAATCVLAVALRVTRRQAAVAMFLGACGTLVPHLIFGQGLTTRYYFLSYLLFLSCVLLVGGPIVSAVRTSARARHTNPVQG